MNFVCDKCKQKYHVADEKIRGRAVTRFRCKKCENVIELRSDALPDPDAPDAPRQIDEPDPRPRAATMAPATGRPGVAAIGPSAPPGSASGVPPARTAVRARSATSVGVAFNAGMASSAAKAAPRTASTSSILNASETGWYAGIRDLPVGPLTRKELIAKVQASEVTPDTLVWREGLDDWRPLRNVAELGDVLRLGAQRMSGSLLDEMGRRPPPATPAPERRSAQVVPLRQPVASAPAVTRPAMSDDDEEATRVTGLDPAIAALIPRSLGATPKAAPAKSTAEEEPGDQTLTEPPFAKPAGRAPAPPPPKAAPPKAPLRAASAAKAPPAAPEASPTPAPESMPAMAIDAISSMPPAMAIESTPPPRTSGAPSAAALSALAGDDDLPEDLFGKKPFPPQSNAPSLESFGISAAFSSGAPPPASTPAPGHALAPSHAAVVALGSVPGHSPTLPGYVPPAAAAAPRPAGLSMPVVILMAGVLVVGVFGGVLLAGRLNRPVVQPVPAPVPVAAPQPPAPAPAPAPVEPPTVAAAEPAAPAAEAPDTEPAVPGHPRAPRRPGRDPVPAPTTAPSAADLQRLAALQAGGGPSGSPIGAPRNPTASSPGEAPGPAVTGAARAGRAIRAFQESRVANNCWQQLLRQNPAVRDAAVRITLTVNGQGRITSTSVSGSPDPRFDTCIRSGAGRVAPIGAGEAFDAQTTVNLTTGG